MSRLIKRTGLIAFMICLLVSCREQAVYDVVIVGGGPAGIGAALGASGAGAKVALLERDTRIGGTTVQAEVVDMGLFYAWKKQIIDGPVWDLVKEAVDTVFDGAFAPVIPKPQVMVCRFQADANLIGAVYNFIELQDLYKENQFINI